MTTALIFAIIFGAFGWFIYKMLRFTAKSVGDESPLAVVVTYEKTAWDYFTRFNFLFNFGLVFLILMLFYIGLFLIPKVAKHPVHWLLAAFLLAISGWGVWFLWVIAKLEWQYWTITRNRVVTMNPADRSLKIEHEQDCWLITPDNIDTIECHFPGRNSSKMVAGYSYLLFRLNDGQSVYLNRNSIYLDFALDEYFKNVPQQVVEHKIPWIKPI